MFQPILRCGKSISHWYLAETVLTNLLSVPYDIAKKSLIVTLNFLGMCLDLLCRP